MLKKAIENRYCSHNRLSAFGVIGTLTLKVAKSTRFIKSQSPFGFWGDRNLRLLRKSEADDEKVTIAFRLLG